MNRTEKEITSIDIVFENCEVARIPRKQINYFAIDGVKEKITFNIHGEWHNKVSEHFYISIRKKYLETQKMKNDNISILERIQRTVDIASVSIIYKNKMENNILVPWGKQKYTNEYQKVKVADDEVFIEIKK